MFAPVKVTAAPARAEERDTGECRVVCVNDERVARARAAAPDAESLQRVADRFAALSDPTRLRILLALSRAELCVCDLATVAERSMPATSQQLKLLRSMGLVKFRTAGKLAYYSLADEWVRSALRDALAGSGGARR
jgi:DNA-binding transcriptional ArsR family regulator